MTSSKEITVKMPDRINFIALREFAESCSCEIVRDKNGDLVFIDVSKVVKVHFGRSRNRGYQPTSPGAA